jgi:hypothetical protein
VTASARLTREQILALPPAITLAELAAAFGVSQPTIRAMHRRGDLEAMGVKVNRLGNQYRVTLASVLAYLGLTPGASSAPSPGEDTGQRDPATPRVRFLAPPLRAVD